MMTTAAWKAVFAALCFLVAAPLVQGYSFGAGGCDGGVPAIGPQHLAGGGISSTVINGTLAQGSITVLLDGIALTPSTTIATDFAINQDHTLTLQRSSQYKGLLFRLGGVSLGAMSVTDPLLQIASLACTPLGVSGITHNSNTEKTESNATLRLNTAASNLPLDVTVVIRNNGVSEYYYSPFRLNAVAAVATTAPIAPTTAPIAPTTAPIAPTTAPVAPTTTPTTPNTRSPTVAPSTARPIAPSSTPVASTSAPISVPVAPTLTPIAATSAPTSTPIAPSSAPAQHTSAPAAPALAPSSSTSSPSVSTTVPAGLGTPPAPPTKRPIMTTAKPAPTRKPSAPTKVPRPPSRKPSSRAPVVSSKKQTRTRKPTRRTHRPTTAPRSHPVVPSRKPVRRTRRPTTRKPAVRRRRPSRRPHLKREFHGKANKKGAKGAKGAKNAARGNVFNRKGINPPGKKE